MAVQRVNSIKKVDIHNWHHKIELLYKQIESELSEYNYQIIKKYDKEMIIEGLKNPTRYLHLSRLFSLSRRLKKDWKDINQDDIKNVITEIMDKYSDEGQDTEYTYDHKKVLKIFFRWLKLGYREYRICLEEKNVGDPPETRRIKMKKPKCKLRGTDLVSDLERQWLLDACESSRDKALIDLPLDGGIRPGELLTLSIGSLKHDKHGYVAYVNGKTGTRTVRLVRSIPSLARWLSEHPFKDNPNAPLWITFEKSKYGKPLAYSAARAIIHRVCEKVREKHHEFDKRIFLNLFRHTEATNASTFMTDGISKMRHGWSDDSRMPSRYSHLNNSDVEKSIFEHYGIETSNNKKIKLPMKCSSCDMLNDENSRICSKCGKPLDLKTALELDEDNEKRLSSIEDEVSNLKLLLKQALGK